jgi:hypothetical protein
MLQIAVGTFPPIRLLIGQPLFSQAEDSAAIFSRNLNRLKQLIASQAHSDTSKRPDYV